MRFVKLAMMAGCLGLLSASLASAADFSKVMINDEGKPLCMKEVKEGEECAADKVATLARIVKSSLYASFPDEEKLSGEDKYKRAELAQSITGATKELKPKAEDIALMKKLVAKLYSPLIVFQAWRELDPPQN